jgi:carbon storage regulator
MVPMGLVISRELHEILLIGDTISVQIVSIRQGKVRLKIDAPKDVSVDRLEVRVAKTANTSGEATQ